MSEPGKKRPLSDKQPCRAPSSADISVRKKQKRPQQKRRKQPGVAQCDQARYSIVDGLRIVTPYTYRFEVFCKQRWLGRTLIDVVSREWVAYSEKYFRRAILWGLVLVNDNIVDPTYVLKQKDLISHLVHRHEPPVIGDDIKIICNNSGGLVVVDKPATMPVHPCGSYFYNSVVSILAAFHEDLQGIKTIHRLDRLTSGILLLAKDSATVKKVSENLRSDGNVEKVYYARVVGRFPQSGDDDVSESIQASLSADQDWITAKWLAPKSSGDSANGRDVPPQLEFSCPLKCIVPAKSRHSPHRDGKEAVTLFSLVTTNGTSSIVRCVPKTGRTHQIRLHLQKLGFPIENDPNYGPDTSSVAAAATARAAARESLDEKVAALCTDLDHAAAAACSDPALLVDGLGMTVEERAKLLCRTCQKAPGDKSSQELFHEGLFLRAMEYRCKDWSFACELPAWAALKPLADADDGVAANT